MSWTDDPIADFNYHERQQQAELDRLPRCSECGEPIQDDFLGDIEGTIYCLECFDEKFIKATECYTE